MNPRNTGILFVVALVLGAVVYWNEFSRKQSAQQAEEESKQLFADVDESDIQAIWLTTSDGQPARLERRDGAWQLVEPLAFPADSVTLDGMVRGLADMASEGVIEEPQALDVYGLDQPFEVGFRADGQDYRLKLGAKTPVGSSQYATTGATDSVFTIPAFRANSLKRALRDLREKRLLSFDRAGVQRIEARWPDGHVVLEKQGDAWQLMEPVSGPADEVTLDGLLSNLSFLRADDFMDDPAADVLAGLERPRFAVALHVEPDAEADDAEAAESRTVSLAIGDVTVDGKYRAARAAEKSLYLIARTRLDDFPRGVAAYRFKELSQFAAGDAKRLELVFRETGEASVEEVVITARHGDAGWVSEPEVMAPGKAARIVSELARLRAQDIVADAMGSNELAALGLNPPNVVLRVYGAGESTAAESLAEVFLGELDPDLGIAAKSPDGEMVFRLDYELAEHLPVNLEAFRNRFLSEAAEPESEPPPLEFDELEILEP